MIAFLGNWLLLASTHLNGESLAAIRSLKRAGQKPTDVVFPNAQKDFVTRSRFEPCLKEAGIDDCVWHCNRHTFCSWLAMSGASIKEVQVAAGHQTIQMATGTD